MGIGMSVTSLSTALVVHAVAAPIFFAIITTAYYQWFGYTAPLQTAAIFVTVVILADVFVVAMLIEKSFDMFRGFLGTWLVFGLIFASTWLTGALCRRRSSAK
jgi:hypothetical protein